MQAAKEVKSGKAILVDVRDPFSFAANHAEVWRYTTHHPIQPV
jgi:rhodanese-related sulfurtransferase